MTTGRSGPGQLIAGAAGPVDRLPVPALGIFDFPDGAGREIGVFLALIAVGSIACGAADWSTLRGAPLFPPTDDRRRA